MIPPFDTTFAVHLTCEACIKDVSTSLYELDGIQNVNADLENQLVCVTGNAPPSSIVAAIQKTGRDAILRGTGKPDSAAVCILESHATNVRAENIRGLIRMVQVAPALTLLDVTVRGVIPGEYHVTARQSGDISEGAVSTGGIWGALVAQKTSPPRLARGILGTVTVGQAGRGSAFLDRPIDIWELIGRGIVVSRQQHGFTKEDPNTLVGVVARSAGVWENDKTVCSCSGKSVWEEREEQTSRGML
ncbi:putative superoxide dismutase copper chaperone Lys7 [Piedraia hortae CBS 480.64]|uniref:Superoxide dismutase 1 copper chaperone n=1 Tax=Piedraia hortae CBS 480.64 TaxID=1314780 RepID=A0A6A7BYH1_9PEZI|nr:putative superoxide dismutase copper chaperone Lys7 [Piedraia hortae CBS 480.64]